MVSIPLTVTGGGGEPGESGATADDYSDFPASVNFVSGDTEKTFTFDVESDDVDDDLESLLIEFGTLPTGVTSGGARSTIRPSTSRTTTYQRSRPTSIWTTTRSPRATRRT